jgi:hypothetical protein
MDRRDFLVVGSASAITAAIDLQPAEASRPTGPRMSAEQMDAHLRKLDHQLDTITHNEDWFRRQVESLRPADAPPGAVDSSELARCEALAKKILRGMVTLASFRDLPEHGRAHHGMQARMLRGLEESSEAMGELTDYLDSFSPADRMDMEATLNRSPGTLERLAAEIDRASGSLGIPDPRRATTRQMMTFLKRRLDRHSSSVIFDEYLDKVEAAISKPAAQQRLMTLAVSKMGEAGFAAYQKEMQALALSWASTPFANLMQGTGAPSAPAAPTAPVVPPPGAPGAAGPDSVIVGGVRYRIVGQQIMAAQAVDVQHAGSGLETVIAIVTPPHPPRGLHAINGLLMVDVGEAVVMYDIRDPSHPLLVTGPSVPAGQAGAPDTMTPKPVNKNKTSNRLLIATGVLMGLAAVCGLLCIIPNIWVCMLTPLALFFVAGLITMIIGLAIRKK